MPIIEEKLEEALEIIETLVSFEGCQWDHNKNCQSHLDFSYDGSCYNESAMEFLRENGRDV